MRLDSSLKSEIRAVGKATRSKYFDFCRGGRYYAGRVYFITLLLMGFLKKFACKFLSGLKAEVFSK